MAGTIGVLSLGTRRDAAFCADDLASLTQIARQVAIAIENARVFGEVSDLKNKLAQEKLHLEDDIQGMVSLDHAVWFHRPARADDWLFYDVHSLVNAGGRGLLRGAMRDGDRRVVVSVAQEMRLHAVRVALERA